MNKGTSHNDEKENKAVTGNASNPDADRNTGDAHNNQVLDPQAEKYIREAGNIEDLPDENDIEEMDRKSGSVKKHQ